MKSGLNKSGSARPDFSLEGSLKKIDLRNAYNGEKDTGAIQKAYDQ